MQLKLKFNGAKVHTRINNYMKLLKELVELLESIRISGDDSDDSIRRKIERRGKSKRKKRFGKKSKKVTKIH